MILTELEQRVTLDRNSLGRMTERELAQLIEQAQSCYFHGLAAGRAGAEEVARSYQVSALVIR